MIHQASGNNVRNAVSAVRKHFGWAYADTKPTIFSGGEDNLHRVTLKNGHVVEVTVIQHAVCKYEGTMQ